jgi:hypothetical protein
MEKRYTALEWALMEGGHEITPSEDKPFSFLQDIFESRMTKDDGSSQKLTYSDCCERLYLMLLVLETLRRYPSYAATVRDYAKKTAGFELYKFYRIMGTDLYNFIYFLVGSDSAQEKLKDPDAAIALKKKTKIPILDLNRYIRDLAQGKEPTLPTALFIKLETILRITNKDYKEIRRELGNWQHITRQDKRVVATRLIFAVRAKLRSSDIITDFEHWAANNNMEKEFATDPEPTVSKPDISIINKDIAMYRYLVGADKLMLTRQFLISAIEGRTIPAAYVEAYMPIIDMIDDIVQAGPGYIQNLRALHKRAKNKQ